MRSINCFLTSVYSRLTDFADQVSHKEKKKKQLDTLNSFTVDVLAEQPYYIKKKKKAEEISRHIREERNITFVMFQAVHCYSKILFCLNKHPPFVLNILSPCSDSFLPYLKNGVIWKISILKTSDSITFTI